MNKTEEKIYELIKAKATSCDEGGYFCVYPISELANEIRTSERTVMRTLQSLEEQKYILRKRQGRGQEIALQQTVQRLKRSKIALQQTVQRLKRLKIALQQAV